MKLTDNPCRGCGKRTVECRLSCARYKVYHTAKLREYEKRKQVWEEKAAIAQHIRSTKERYRRGSIKFTPIKNGEMKK